ncbi:MAG: SLC13 family permease [Kiritimatiellia bacterium]|jgi:Na+/H+ antiporter NhaD/arsenite permease-like protein
MSPTPPRGATVGAIAKIASIGILPAIITYLAHIGGVAQEPAQYTALFVFLAVICTTLFFWNYRLAAAFLGVAVMIGAKVYTLQEMIGHTDLHIILFLVGMMTIVGALKDLGLFSWLILAVISRKRMNGWIFTATLCLLSAVLASVVDEVTSIVVMLALVFQVCDALKIRSMPFVLISVMATNVGSSATMLGNPVGIFIGSEAGFSFGDFLTHATPIAFLSLVATTVAVMIWYRKEIHEMSVKMAEHREANQGLGPLFPIPYKRGLFVLLSTVVIIAFHRQIETLLGLTDPGNQNAFLILTPLIVAGLLMIYRPHRARHYIEREVEWWTLVFFMMLFAIAGSLAATGITENLAAKLQATVSGGAKALVPFVLFGSAIGSAFVDNIVFVAAGSPVIQALIESGGTGYETLWWALLFGACFGGNITAIGSTANIVALGMMEKRYHTHVLFWEWLKIGAVVGLVSCLVAWGCLYLMPLPAP